MKICYVTTTVHISKDLKEAIGATTHTYAIASELTKLGHEVHIISEKFKGDKDDEVINGLRIHRLLRAIVKPSKEIKKSRLRKLARFFKFIPNFLLGLKVASLVKRYKCDLILERAHSLGVGAIASLMTGKPLILEVIDYIYSKISAQIAKYIIAYTKAFFNPRIQKKVCLVEAGYDPRIFKPKDLPIKYDVCYVGAFKEWDGLEDLVEAGRLVVRQRAEIKFLLVGDGVRRKVTEDLIKKYGLENNFILTGRIPLDQVPDYICQSKITVAPFNIKRSEKGKFLKYGYYFSPLKIFEYMACGKPIMATSYPKISNIIKEKSGLLFKEGDTKDLADKTLYLLSHPELMKKISDYNIELAKKYTWAMVVKEFDNLIKKI